MIINSLLDNDLYKFSMMQAVLHNFPSAEAEYKLVIRSNVNIGSFIEEIEYAIRSLGSLRFMDDELQYLRKIRFIKRDFVDFLEDFKLKARYVEVDQRKDGQVEITVQGPWVQTILLEVPILAIVEEIYCKNAVNSPVDMRSRRDLLLDKIDLIRQCPGLRFADFGTRRRLSFDWQDEVVKILSKYVNSNQFTGTSNVFLAKKYEVKAIGTMAHEFIQAGQGLGMVKLVDSQKFMLETWAKEYRGDLGIALTDTIGMDAFLKDFDLYLAKLYDGCRQDSGDPIEWGEKLLTHYRKLGINPMTKTAVFSDGLDFPKAIKIYNHFKDKIQVSFGIGTNLTNDGDPKPLSIVMKLFSLNGNPVAKISDEPGKTICDDKVFLEYLKKVFKVNGEKL